MKMWWIGACALVVLGCRAEERDQALGSDRPGAQGRPGELAAPPKVAEPAKPPGDVAARPGARANDEKAATERLLTKALEMSQKEVDAGKLAKDRAASPEVRALATKLVSEHQQDVDSIRRLAGDKKLDLKSMAEDDPIARAGAAAHEERLEKLRGLKGGAFDFAYVGPEPDRHAMFAKIAEEGQRISSDPEIDGLFMMLSGQARDHSTEIERALPAACGGQPGKPEAGGSTPGR